MKKLGQHAKRYANKVDADDTKVKVVYKASFIPKPACSVEQKRCRDGVLYILPSLLCHPRLPCLRTFWHAVPTFSCILKIFYSCLCTFGGYNLFQCTITLI